MLLMRRCCCFDLRTGCIVMAIVRLITWVIILTASVYTCLHVFSPDDKGLFHYKVIINIEKNGKVHISTTGCVICIWTVVQMELVLKLLKPHPWKILQLFAMIFSSFFENLKVLHLKVFHLWPQKGQKFSLKKGAFDTPLLLSIKALNELKNYWKLSF